MPVHDRKCSKCSTSGDEWIDQPCGWPGHEVRDVESTLVDILTPEAISIGISMFREFEAKDRDEGSSEISTGTEGLITFRYFYSGGSASVTVNLLEDEYDEGDVRDACRSARRCAKKASPY